jgi:hypothetical protein
MPMLLTPRAAVALGALALLLEMLLITPWFDELADSNDLAHFSQHGLIFLGGVLMGVALRDLLLLSRRA